MPPLDQPGAAGQRNAHLLLLGARQRLSPLKANGIDEHIWFLACHSAPHAWQVVSCEYV